MCHLNWSTTAICHKTVCIVWISLKNYIIWKLRLCFIPKVTHSVLSGYLHKPHVTTFTFTYKPVKTSLNSIEKNFNKWKFSTGGIPPTPYWKIRVRVLKPYGTKSGHWGTPRWCFFFPSLRGSEWQIWSWYTSGVCFEALCAVSPTTVATCVCMSVWACQAERPVRAICVCCSRCVWAQSWLETQI